MKHLVKYVMSYPLGFVPSDWESPEDYLPEGSLEDYKIAFQAISPAVGQQFEHYGDSWVIAQVQTYCPLEPSEAGLERFHMALCTWDGNAPIRIHWGSQAPLLVITAAPSRDEVSWSLVEHEEDISATERIAGRQHFRPIGKRLPGDFDTVVVAWADCLVSPA